MKINWSELRAAAPLPLLIGAASCVPSAGALPRVAPAPVHAQAQVSPQPAASQDAMAEARRQFWIRAAQLLEPVSAQPAAPFEDTSNSDDDRARSLDCLASAIYYEARSESEDGQRAVAQVVLNRVRHPAFPSTICGVVFQGSERRTGCQFSFTCDGSMARRPVGEAWDRARRIAIEAIQGSVFAAVGNATHYHTTAIRPYWAPSLRKSAIVGAHIFYRWAGTAGEASAFRQRYGGLEPSVATMSQTPEELVGLPRVHRGSTPDDHDFDQASAEDLSGVRVHRGSRAPSRSADPLPQTQTQTQTQPEHVAVAPEGDAGVRVHVGIPGQG